MIALLRNTRILTRIILAITVPMLAMVWQAGTAFFDALHADRAAQMTSDLVILASDLNHVISEIQRERAHSTGFISDSSDQSRRSALAAQRQKSDQATSRLTRLGMFDEALGGRPAAAKQALAGLIEFRKRIDSGAVDVNASNTYFAELVEQLLEVNRQIPKQVEDPHAVRLLMAYVALLEGQEFAGRERAAGAAPFSKGFFSMVEVRRISELVAAQEANFADFKTYADAELAAALDAVMAGANQAKLHELRQAAADSVTKLSTGGHSFDEWIATTTARIDELMEINDKAAAKVLALSAAKVSASQRTLLILGLSLLAITALTVVLTTVIVRSITRPLAMQTAAMGRLAEGDTGIEIDGVDAKDELGAMARALEVFRTNALAMEEMKAQQERDRLQAEEDKRRAMLAMADDFEGKVKGVVEGVSAASHQLEGTAQAMSALADQASGQSTQVAAASEEAAANVQTVASAAEQLAASIGEISRQVAESASIAGQAVSEAGAAEAVIRQLADASQRIGEVVDLINDVASQTNLLALNATIEAARAGEAGKGFAVVANEVKSLANQTAKATDEISAQIQGVQQSADNAVAAVASITGIIRRISEIASAIASAVEEQGAATGEIARNVEQAAAGTQEVSHNIVGVQQAVGSVGTSAAEVLSAAQQLARQSSALNNEVAGFIAGIRA